MFVFHGGALLGGCALDWLFGDPRWLPHPVRLMGRMIAWLEGLLRPRFSGRERAELRCICRGGRARIFCWRRRV